MTKIARLGLLWASVAMLASVDVVHAQFNLTTNDDNTITMKVKPEVSSVESTITTADGSSIPVIRISEAEASLVVKDGITVVLGGLMEDSKATT